LNVLIYMCMPILIPTFVTIAFVTLSRASKVSRARLKLLEKDDSQGERLVNILADIEKKMQEDAVVTVVKDSTTEVTQTRSVLTSVQRRMAESLNRLPIHKEIVFIDEVRNSHATIVCRDIKRFKFHKRGEGVLRHWAASFVL